MILDPPRRFFIAHSSADKDLVVALHDSLGADVWVDAYEINVGQIILEEVAQGIENATDFVFMWSANSASSRWARFEFHMAFIRYLEDNAIAIRIVALDDTPLPLYLRPFLQARETEPEHIAQLIRGDPPSVRPLRTFINRNDEIGRIESTLYSDSRGITWIWGIPGIGKRSIVREAMNRLVAAQGRVRRLEVRAGTGYVELALAVRSALGVEIEPGELTEKEARTDAVKRIRDFGSAEGIWVFEEAQHWLDDNAEPNPVLGAVIVALRTSGVSEPGRIAVFTSRRRPTLDPVALEISDVRHVRGLDTDFAAALLRTRGATAPDSVLRRAAGELDGHPLSLEVVARQISTGELDWEEERVRVANTVVGAVSLEETTQRVFERIALVDGPLSGQDLADHLGLEGADFQAAIEEGVSYSLVEESDRGYLRLHPLVRDFFMRSLRRRAEFQEVAADLARRSNEILEVTAAGSTIYVDALVTTFRLLVWAGSLDEAFALRRDLYGTLYEAAMELYNQREYDTALRYFEQVAESVDDNRHALLYVARCLAYLGRVEEARRIVDDLLEERPTDHHLLRVRGRIEFIARNWPEALVFYERAQAVRPNMPALLRDIGQVKLRLDDWDGARAALERAVQNSRDPDPWILFQYCQVLEHFGELEDARRVMSDAIRRDPQNVGFHHRLGRIAQRMGDLETAVREYQTSLRLDPTYFESLLTLATISIDAGDIEEARGYLATARKSQGVPRAVVHNVSASIALAERDFDEARKEVQHALEARRDVQNLDLAARIEIEAATAGEATCQDARAAVTRFVEEMRLDGAGDAGERILDRLQEVCPE